MRKIHEPRYILAARQLLSEVKRRVERQARRVERIEHEGRDPSRAKALLERFRRRCQRCQQALQSLLGWYSKYRRSKLPRQVRLKLTRGRSRRESKKDKREQWDHQVRTFLDEHYPETPHYKASLLALWEKYLSLGLPTAHFVSEFTSGKKNVVFQRAWEMMLARHLDAQGFAITTENQGPDFRFEHEGKIYWVEAVSPEPMGLPDHWMAGPKPIDEIEVHDVPHNEVLLRWTSAIKAKADKLNEYRAKRIVGEKDAYIIAANGCQLGAMPFQHGISQLPFALEAVYPAGPISVEINRETLKAERSFVSTRPEIETAKGKPVSTTLFLDKKYKGVSAVASCTFDRSEEAILPLDIVHNHEPEVPMRQRLLGTAGEEWITEPDGKGGIDIKKLERTPGG